MNEKWERRGGGGGVSFAAEQKTSAADIRDLGQVNLQGNCGGSYQLHCTDGPFLDCS